MRIELEHDCLQHLRELPTQPHPPDYAKLGPELVSAANLSRKFKYSGMSRLS